MPIANGNDALLALMPDSGEFVVLRVPYPMGFYAKGWTVGSTIPRLAGEEEGSRRPTARGHPFMLRRQRGD